MLQRIIFLGFAARLCIAMWNGFWGPSFGSELDPMSFHESAADLASNVSLDGVGIGSIYVLFLAGVYWLTTDSLFLGSLLSCFAWLGSALILARCLRLLDGQRSHQQFLMVWYCFLPSSIMWTAVTLREPYQLLFINMAALAALHIVSGGRRRYWALFAAASMGAGILHGALLASMAVSAAGLLLLLSYRKRGYVLSLKSFGLALLSCAALVIGAAVFNEFSYGASGNLIDSIEQYQEGLVELEARSNYKEPVPLDGMLNFLLSVSFGFFQYLTEPYPWRVSALVDAITLAENVLRLILFFYGVRMLVQGQRTNLRPFYLWALLTTLATELIWSVGTVNWGTALRHHLPSMGLLLLATYGGLSLKRAHKKVAAWSGVPQR